jgi:hypothetical protein
LNSTETSTKPLANTTSPIDYYGNATKFFTEEDLEAAYSPIFIYANIAMATLEASWAGWQVLTSFASRFYFFELGNYTGRLLANLFVLVDWIIGFDRITATRRVRAAVMA